MTTTHILSAPSVPPSQPPSSSSSPEHYHQSRAFAKKSLDRPTLSFLSRSQFVGPSNDAVFFCARPSVCRYLPFFPLPMTTSLLGLYPRSFVADK